MNIHQSIGIVSRSLPVTSRNYWFGQRPMENAMPAKHRFSHARGM
jgi:hypothetical protein